uniref:Uncharacterized protein n=1 Tax=Panagrolaimus sp. ES5 TaxID=591445 RepID=A0AC34F5Q0_9BILA
MGDHGPNFGFYRYEEVIGYEDMNPMLYISVPKFLREDEKLSNILVQNSKKLVTHFDLYSTFIDIAISYGAEIPIDTTLHGESLFKPIQDGRDCSKLGVSPMFCNCRYKREMLAINDSLHSKIIDKIFENGNETIYPYRNVCKIPVFDSRFIPIIEQIFMPGTSKSLKVFKVTFETKPDYGRWWTYVHVHHTKNHSITNINNMMQFGIRINPAGWKCLTNILNFCFCIKNSLWYENP